MRNWTVEVTKDLNITVRSQKKDEAEKVKKVIRKLLTITAYYKELNGIFGKDESEHELFVIGQKYYPDNYEKYQQDTEEFLKSIPAVITDADVGDIIEEAGRIFGRHVKIIDNRQTEDEVAKEEEQSRKINEDLEAKRKTEHSAFVSEWCLPEKIVIPEGRMGVFLEITYDNSDAMSDYYAPHVSVGLPMLLEIVSPQPKTERLARGALSIYPDLKKYKWTWHVENYSMGHGNYLVSEYTGNCMRRHAYDNKEEVNTRFEIRFCKGGNYYKEMYPYKHYKTSLSEAEAEEVAPQAAEGVVMRLNEMRNGVELTFSGKPTGEIVSQLKVVGFRYSPRKQLWYAKQSPVTIAVAERLSAATPQQEPPTEEVLPEAASLNDETASLNAGPIVEKVSSQTKFCFA